MRGTVPEAWKKRLEVRNRLESKVHLGTILTLSPVGPGES